MASSPKLRIDRSRPYGEVHGERSPDDPHAPVFFFQDGLPFDAQGVLVYDAIHDEKIRAIADKKLKKLAGKAAVAEPVDDGDGDDDDDDSEDTGGGKSPPVTPGDVNLESWLRGEANYHWATIAKTIRERYHQNISKQADAVAFLVYDEKVIPEDQVAADLLALLPKA